MRGGEGRRREGGARGRRSRGGVRGRGGKGRRSREDVWRGQKEEMRWKGAVWR